MADVAAKKSRKPSKKVLKPKAASTNDANILAQELTDSSPVVPSAPSETSDLMKENHQSVSSAKKGKGKAAKGAKQQQASFDMELEQMQEMLEQLKLEKEKTEEMLKEKDEMLKAREEELENKGKQQEKMQAELKKLQKIKKENPNADFKEVSNILGAKWKTVSAEEKKPYEEKYQAEKEVYLQVATKEKRETEAMKLLEEEQKQKTAMELLQQYLQFLHDADDQGSKKTKKEKDPLKPKQPMSAFFIFSNDRRAALLADNKNVTEAAKIAGEEWKNMTEKQKSPYEKIAKKNKEKYLIEMEAYKQKKEEEAMNIMKEEEEHLKLQKQEAMQLLKKKEKTDNIIKKTKEEEKQNKKKNQNTDPNKPKKPASSFFLFSKEARKSIMQERPGVNNSTVTALISLKWKELKEEERQIWNAKAAETMDAYKKEIEEYNKSLAAGAPAED
ncbi:High mobility group B protein 13 [Linum perenne]